MYLESYPAEVNQVFRERRYYDGSYDRHYVKSLGTSVFLDDQGNKDTIWNVKVPGYFQDVADALHRKLIEESISTIFFVNTPYIGGAPNKDSSLDIIWHHFYSRVPHSYVKNEDMNSAIGTFNNNVAVFHRGLKEITLDSVELIRALIKENNLYRGSEFAPSVDKFIFHKKVYDALTSNKAKQHYVFFKVATLDPSVLFRNSVIGTLALDLSEGVEVDIAVKSFESKVAPTNYKRTSSIITTQMVDAAKAKLQDLGLMDSIYRRTANLEDIPLNQLLYTSQKKIELNPLDTLSNSAAKKNTSKLTKATEISMKQFISKTLPTATKVEALVTHTHEKNFFVLMDAKMASAPLLFQWDNSFSWSYNGNITDAIQERVKNAGGSLEGDLRISLSWHNHDDLDLHVYDQRNNHIYFGNKEGGGGKLDVDANSPSSRLTTTPVENIVWRSIPKGKYLNTWRVNVTQYHQRTSDDVGFTIQVAYQGKVFNFTYNRMVRGTIKCFDIVYTNGEFTIKEIHKDLVNNASSNQNIWDVTVGEFTPVTAVFKSPNFWEKPIGNEHIFFALEGCKTQELIRGIYNEFLKPELYEHRKVMEHLGGITMVTPDPKLDQVAGLGFSFTIPNQITFRVATPTGIRLYNVKI